MELEVAADHPVELRPGADLGVRALRDRRRRSPPRRCGIMQRAAGRKSACGEPPALGVVQRVEPRVGERVDLGAVQLLIAVAVALLVMHGRERRRRRRTDAIMLAGPPPAGGRRRVLVIRVGRRMDAGEPLAAAHEVEERLPARGRRRGVAGIVEERAGRACKKDSVVLLEVGVVDVRRVVGDRRRPRAGLLAHLLDRVRGQRNRRVDEPRGLAEDEHLSRLHWLAPARWSGSAAIIASTVTGCGVCWLRAASAHVERRGQPGRRHCRVERGRELVAGDGAGSGRVRRGEPLASRGLQFLAGDDAVLVGVSREEHERGRKESLEGRARAERRAPLPC